MPLPEPNHRRIRVSPSGVLPHGIYDLMVDPLLSSALQAAKASGIEVEESELKKRDSRLLAREIAMAVAEQFEQITAENGESSPEHLAFANGLLNYLAANAPPQAGPGLQLTTRVLRRIGQSPQLQPTDLSEHGLLTGRETGENLLLHLRRELATCDRADWLVSFIKLRGVCQLEGDIEAFLRRGGELRVATTAYMGATEPRALDALVAISRQHGGRLRIKFSRAADSTRLHAKSYIHHRDTGFGSAYVGSANLSRPALTDGLEWTVRLSQSASPGLWSKMTETFDQWWGDPDFTEYAIAESDPSHSEFQELIHRAKAGSKGSAYLDVAWNAHFSPEPKPFQQAVLERIQWERTELGKTRHLVVSATGTGKTMIAGFDYRQFRREFIAKNLRVPRLLYIAHTARILEQARAMFALVLRERNFGGLLVDGQDERESEGVFASIQSWNSKRLSESFSRNHFDYVVVDEVHHGEANTWRRLLDWISPQSLIGLTATPERADGRDIRMHFGGSTTAEIRLPAAIEQRLLVPFHYFGVTDDVDLRDVAWTRHGYETKGLEEIYLRAGERWVDDVRQSIYRYVSDPMAMRALGFCCSIRHANLMCAVFEEIAERESKAGRSSPRAAVITGEHAAEDRARAIERLRKGETQILFSVDLLNEGVDIPEVDTVLLLRPTSSLTVYLQQIGRGLRLSPHTSKDCLTVLDFVGQHRREFPFEERFRALTIRSLGTTDSQIENGTFALPAGSSITLEPIARLRILTNLRQRIQSNRQRITHLVRNFIADHNRVPAMHELDDPLVNDPRTFYVGRNSSWGRIVAEATGSTPYSSTALDDALTTGLLGIASTDDAQIADAGLSLIARMSHPGWSLEDESKDARLEMILGEFRSAFRRSDAAVARPTAKDALERLQRSQPVRDELSQLLPTIARSATSASPIGGRQLPPEIPLRIHRRYTRAQILLAFGWREIWHSPHQQGVHWFDDYRSLVLFVTLDKGGDTFTDRTRFRDFAISPTEFHWQSQRATGNNSTTRHRIDAAKRGEITMWLFLREAPEDALGTQPFAFMGGFTPTEIEGANPVSVIGRLDHSLPANWFDIASRAR